MNDGGYRGVVDGTVVDIWQRASKEVYWEAGPNPFTADQMRAYFRLDDDLEAIRVDIGDHRVDEAFQRYPGLRILSQDPWETLISFVISQVSNVPRISKTVETLATHYGDHLGDGVSNAFPRPEQLARADESALRLLGLGYRAPHLVVISNAVADGELFLEPLKYRSYDEAREELMAFPGVGPKVADCSLLFSLDHLEGFPVDRWVIRAVEDWYDISPGTTQEAMGRWARDSFGQYAGYAGQYLFHARRDGGTESLGTGPRGPSDMENDFEDPEMAM